MTRAFVLYAAEWWQRRYDGRHWAWEPLLASIGWYSVDYPELYESVRKAWSWWKVDLVRLPTSIRYLGTFACQGGLPLVLVGDTDSRVTQYLRAVLKHTAAYRQFVDDPIDLARDQQHLLNPPTLRRDYVFRLAADLIEAVLDLQNDIESDSEDEDPLNALDQARPDWRRTMPLALEDARARPVDRAATGGGPRPLVAVGRVPCGTFPASNRRRMVTGRPDSTSRIRSCGSLRTSTESLDRRPAASPGDAPAG